MIDENGESLYENLSQYARRGLYPFHMPGHKGNINFMPPATEWLKLDVTELDETDNLHAPQASILETQRRISLFYGADESFLLVNGATAGIMAAIFCHCNAGDTIAVARNCHRSVFSGMAWAGANPAYFLPEVTEEGLASRVSPSTVKDVLSRNASIKAVIITSPTYEGYVSDINAIAEITHEHDCILIVDEAHGAHFLFHSAFPQSALECGANIVIQSFHKTLPTFSQNAVLHTKGLATNASKRLKLALQCLQTSSPCFLLMATTDYMLNLLWKEPAHFDSYVENLLNLRNKLSKNHNIRLLEREKSHEKSYDIGKIVLTVPHGKNGNTLSQQLSEEFGLKMEMSSQSHILAMTSVADNLRAFERLAEAISLIDADYGTDINQEKASPTKHPPMQLLPEIILPPREALGKPSRPALIAESIGKISGGFVMPYPPGIPILAPGERISQAVQEAAGYYGLVECEVVV